MGGTIKTHESRVNDEFIGATALNPVSDLVENSLFEKVNTTYIGPTQ
jgi:hypothetical protein